MTAYARMCLSNVEECLAKAVEAEKLGSYYAAETYLATALDSERYAIVDCNWRCKFDRLPFRVVSWTHR